MLEVLETEKKKLNIVSCKLSLPAFYEGDMDLLAQYYKLIKPVTKCSAV